MSVLRHSIAQWLCFREHGDWRYDPERDDCRLFYEQAGKLLEHIAPHLPITGAVALTDEQWTRVLDLLHRPVPPGPTKDLDVAIIRSITNQRGQ